jgi:type IV secretion system protein VirD4
MRAVGFGAGSMTRSTEHRPLLSKQEIRDMDPDKIIILPERQNPILADRIKYYESREILKIHKAQNGHEYPFPKVDQAAKSMTMKEVREAASVAKTEDQAAAEKGIATMTSERSAATTSSVHKRTKKAVKGKASGPLSAAAHAAFTDAATEAQKQLKRQHGPKAA